MTINNFDVDKKHVATVLYEQSFFIGKDASVEVVVNLYESNGVYRITSWLNGVEECNTEIYTGSVDDEKEILSAMEELVNSHEDYILDLADWDGE